MGALQIVASLTVLLAASRQDGDAPTQTTRHPFDFVDVAKQAGVTLRNVSGDPRRWYIPESNGCGAAWLDYDGDGDVDLFVASGAGLRYVDDGRRLEVVESSSSRLYRNDTRPSGPLRFTDVTGETGAGCSRWINAVAVGDIDGDGDPDLYLACFGEDVLLRNDGGRFVDATEESGLGNELMATGATFGDPDLDGDLDLYVANYVLFDPEHPPLEGRRNTIDGVEVGWGPEQENGRGLNPGAPNRYFVNDGTGRFEERTREAGLELEKPLCSYAAVFCDVDGDLLPDLLVANDMQPTNLFRNLGEGRFAEEGVTRGFATGADGNPTSAMGLFAADVDMDGDFDVLRTNFDFEANSLHVNDGHGRFEECAGAVGLAEPSLDRLGWGGGFFDADLDGDLDLFVANGHVYPQAEAIGMNPWLQASQLFECVQGPDGRNRWRDATARAGADLGARRSARGVAFGDPDSDGDLDLVVVDVGEPPRLLENRTPRRGRWLAVRTLGSVSNRDGYGARVSVHAGERTWTREMRVTDGLYSSHDPRLYFGLGPIERVDRVEVRWPSGRRSVVSEPDLDALLTITEPADAESEEADG